MRRECKGSRQTRFEIDKHGHSYVHLQLKSCFISEYFIICYLWPVFTLGMCTCSHSWALLCKPCQSPVCVLHLRGQYHIHLPEKNAISHLLLSIHISYLPFCKQCPIILSINNDILFVERTAAVS